MEDGSTEVSFCPMSAIGDKGELDTTFVKSSSAISNGYTRFENGDVIVAKITPCFENGKGALARNLINGIGYGTTELFVLRAGSNLDARFLYYATVSRLFRGYGEAFMTGAAGQKRVPSEFAFDFPLGFPHLSEQAAIADYLDRETARIDELVAEKEKMLALLEEKRNALVTRAVTRGLDPNAKMKDSGVEWLGEIPAAWQIRRVAFLFIERDERNEPNLPLLNVSLNTGVTVREFSEDRIERTAEDFTTYKVARMGDVAFNKMRMWQGAVGIAPVDGLVSPDYVVAKPGPDVWPDYFGYLLRIPPFGAEAARRSHGIVWDRLRLYWDDFRDMRVPLPPLAEQRAIVEALSAELAEARELETALKESIGLLSERRAALITAAVTGQIDVPGMN